MPQELTVQGRVVWGHPGKLSPKKDRNKQTIMKDGKPVEQCAFGVAIDKNTFYTSVLPILQAEARAAFPQAQPCQISPQFPGGLMNLPQSFAWKFKDGDGVDHMGRPFHNREGHAGNCILTVSTQGFAPTIYKSDGHGGWLQMNPEEVKCGDFVAVKITVKYNGSSGTNTPGLYINPNGVLFLGYGTEIATGADPDEMFSGFQPQQFAGMTSQPMIPQGVAMPTSMQPQQVQPGVGGYPQQPAVQYAPVAQPQYQQPAQLPPPAHDFVQNAIQQPQYAPVAQPQYQQPVAAPQQYAPVQPPVAPVQGGYVQPQAQPVTGYPSNTGYPGMPTGR